MQNTQTEAHATHPSGEIMNQECMLYHHHQHALLEIAANNGGLEIQNVVATVKKEGK